MDKWMVIYVDVIYKFMKEEQKYEAVIRAYLPAENGFVPDLFLNEKKRFFGRELTYCWGKEATDKEGYRVATSFVYADDPDKVRQKAKDKIEREIDHLRDVVRENVLAAKKVPEPEHYEFVI